MFHEYMNINGIVIRRHYNGIQIETQSMQDKSAAQIRENKLDYGDALNALKAADPEGWESWYDNNLNIPEIINWKDTQQVQAICAKILARAFSFAVSA